MSSIPAAHLPNRVVPPISLTHERLWLHSTEAKITTSSCHDGYSPDCLYHFPDCPACEGSWELKSHLSSCCNVVTLYVSCYACTAVFDQTTCAKFFCFLVTFWPRRPKMLLCFLWIRLCRPAAGTPRISLTQPPYTWLSVINTYLFPSANLVDPRVLLTLFHMKAWGCH
jgi:hypothetical protein